MKCKHGWHLGNTIPLGDGQKRDIRKVPPAMVVFITHEHIGKPQLEWIRGVRDDCLFVFRPYFVPSDSLAAYQAYEDKCVDMLTWHNGWDFLEDWQCFLQPYNEPNMPHKMPDGSINTQWEGFGTQPPAIARYNERFCIVHDRAKATNPKFKTVVMNLTPGNHDVFFNTGAQVRAAFVSGKRSRIGPDGDQEYWTAGILPMDTVGEHYYMHGPQSAKPNPTPQEIQDSINGCLCRDALLRADVLGSHIYVVNGGPAIDALWLGRRFVQQAKFLPKEMPILITECGIGGDFSGIRRWYDHIHDCNGQDAGHPDVLATGWWRLGFEVRDGPLVEDLHNYYLEFDGDPPPPPPPPPDLCEEAEGTTDDELICIVAADFHNVLTFYHNNGWPVGKPHQQRAVLCDWIRTPGFLEDEKYGGTWEGYMVYWGCREAPPPEPPIANFTANPVLGDAPLVVTFTDMSFGDIGEWWWDFGDGVFSPTQNPSHTYALVGNYTVRLTVTGPGGTDSLQRVGYIRVSEPPPQPPSADFIVHNGTGPAPLLVEFENTSTGEVDRWEWDFGDGKESLLRHPLHSYLSSGEYTVTLGAFGPGGTSIKIKAGVVEVTQKPEPPPPIRVAANPRIVGKVDFLVGGGLAFTLDLDVCNGWRWLNENRVSLWFSSGVPSFAWPDGVHIAENEILLDACWAMPFLRYIYGGADVPDPDPPPDIDPPIDVGPPSPDKVREWAWANLGIHMTTELADYARQEMLGKPLANSFVGAYGEHFCTVQNFEFGVVYRVEDGTIYHTEY